MNHTLPKTKIAFAVTLAAYSYLFFQQSAGINFLVFALLLMAAMAWEQPTLLRASLWRWLALGSLVSATCLAWHGTALALTATLISLVVLTGYSLQPSASFLVAGIQAIYSLVTALFQRTYRFLDEQSNLTRADQPKASNRLYTYALPVIITLVFFLLYWSANANFATTLGQINLGFISWAWVWFTLGGFLLLFGVFYREFIPMLAYFDSTSSDNLLKQERDYSINNLVLALENNKGVVLLALLNGLLLLVNLNDVVYFAFNKGIPVNSTFSEYVHQGVYTLIVTVLMAIGILLYYFRDDQHFYDKNRRLLNLAGAWVVQNGILLVITAYKNSWYVQEYGLTYKRIGVFVYLLLTLIGLVTTLFKLYQVKDIWFLIRKNSWAFYAVLVLSTSLNWDRMIASYNIHQARTIDIGYILSLSDAILPEIIKVKNNPDYPINDAQKMWIDTRITQLRQRVAHQSWQSWNYDEQLSINN
ncbi:MAG: DUF4173 domain-containing protein [Bacteroidota bacterium]